VSATLFHFTVFYHQNPVRILDGRQPVGDHERGASFEEALDGLLDQYLALRIQGAGGFVENQNLRIPQDGPGNGDPLALAAGQLGAPLADDRIVAVGQLSDEIMG
jgi:hypothetical protein